MQAFRVPPAVPLREVLATSSTPDEIDAAVRAWLIDAMPGLDVGDYPVMGALRYPESSEVAARKKALMEPPQVPVAVAVEQAAASSNDDDPQTPDAIGDDDWVGVKGDTKHWFKKVADIRVFSRGFGAPCEWNKPALQWNIKGRVWKAFVVQNPTCTARGGLELTEYRKN